MIGYELQAQFTDCFSANATLGDQLSGAQRERDNLQKELLVCTGGI